MKSEAFNIPWYKKRVHASWHIAWIAIGLLVGIAVSPLSGVYFTGAEWVVVALACTLPVFVKRTVAMIVLAISAGLLLGLWRGSSEHADIQQYQSYIGKQQSIIGRVGEDTSFGPKGDQRIRLEAVAINGRHLPGTVWVSMEGNDDIKRGDKVTISGMMSEGFGNISASMFKAKLLDIERPVPGDIGRRARDWFGQGVERSMSESDANFALAYLLGQRLVLSDTLNDQLRTVGLIHAVVASGYHLTVLIGLARRLLVKVSKYLTVLFAFGIIGGFMLITGFSPSMTRAGLVSSLGLIAWYYGRVIHPLVLLPFAASITVLYKPEYLWGDVGWYLSFAAFVGVLLVGPLLHHYFWGANKRPGFIREILVATIAAQLATLPIILHVFGYFSIYSVFANLLVVPLIPLTMLLTFVTGVVGLGMPVLATLFGLPVTAILLYMRYVVDWIAGLPAAKTELTFSITSVVASYILMALMVAWLMQKTKHDFRAQSSQQKLF
jgi:competence protein ComEC